MVPENQPLIASEFWIPDFIDDEFEPGLYHEEWRSHLNEKNKDQVLWLVSQPLYAQRFGLYSRSIVKFFMKVCKLLLLPPEVLYLAIDVYDRYWLHYLCDAVNDLFSTWVSVEKDLTKQACLTAMSSIQIASKLCCHNKVLLITTIKEWMYEAGFNVDKLTIIRSELNILRTIGWRMPNVSLLNYVEMFFEEMTHLLSAVSRSELLQVSVKVINISLMFHREIYMKLHLAFQKREMRTLREKIRFLSIEGDSIRLAASVVCAATSLQDPTGQLTAAISTHLSNTTNYNSTEIIVLTNIILHVILRDIANK